MEILSVSTLSSKEKEEIQLLVKNCCDYDNQSLSMPESSDSCYLAYEGDRLIAALCLCRQQQDLWECSAFTLPEYRRQGYFSALFDKALDELEECESEENPVALFFAVHSFVTDTRKTLHSLEAESWYDEYMMELELNGQHFTGDSASDFIIQASGSDSTDSTAADSGNMDFTILVSDSDSSSSAPTPIGHFSLRAFSDKKAYFYGFEITEALRHQGLGSACFPVILNFIRSLGYSIVLLQVSGDNLPAFSLYKKTGFRITETLSYYIYA